MKIRVTTYNKTNSTKGCWWTLWLSGRNARSGISLLPAILSILMITSLVVLIQAQELSKIRTMSRLISVQQDTLNERAVHELLRGPLAMAFIQPELSGISNPKVDGSVFDVPFNGKNWQVALQDVEGLVDIYLADADILRAVGLNARKVELVRDFLLQNRSQGRLPNLDQSLVEFEIDPEMKKILTQESSSGKIALENSPSAVAKKLKDLSVNQRLFQQTKKIQVDVLRPSSELELR